MVYTAKDTETKLTRKVKKLKPLILGPSQWEEQKVDTERANSIIAPNFGRGGALYQKNGKTILKEIPFVPFLF